ncbi:MAG: shikimate dehydrogenase [Nitrospirae bacterium]|nr:MAG: shikimate dehydrogenase [Nitrospirota bacterium]
MVMINAHTQLCGILGYPVEHSLSPAIHNAAFQALNLNYVYLAFPVEDIASALQGLRALGNVRGMSVTIPHKVTALSHVDRLDPTAKRIGAINTIVKTEGTFDGYNTDASGALRALENAGVGLQGKHVVLLGSGGAARAIAFGLVMNAHLGALTILGIDEVERGVLVRDVQGETALPIKEGPLSPEMLAQVLPQAHLLIHCTPVGMYPRVDESCVPEAMLTPCLTVMDIVYNPARTRLLQEAHRAGCQTISGIEMFLYQAVTQFELWTGHPAPVEVMRQVVESQLT